MKWNRRTKLVVATATLLLLSVLAIGIYNAVYRQGEGKGMSLQVDADATAWDDSAVAVSAGEGIRIPGYGTVYFPKNSTEVQLTLYNPKENNCYFIFELCLEGEEQPLYTSGYVEPGKAITQFSLNEGLDAGTYSLYIKIRPYDMQTQMLLNNAVVKTQLIVL